jgi:hypothetical protein
MLTKEERKATAERLNKCEGLGDLYYAVIGEELPTVTTYEQDIDAIFTRLSDLCDTSNMITLPLNKDGQVINIGDTVFDDYGKKWVVNGISFKSSGVLIDTYLDGECARFLPSELTHKQPVTIKSLAQCIKHVLEDEATSIGVNPYVELGRIAEQLESLGDSDEA